MLKLLPILFLISANVFCNNFKIEQIVRLKEPWSMTLVSEKDLLISEKNGKIVLVDILSKKKIELTHNLNFLSKGQGGLLEILYFKDFIYICYVEKRKNGFSNTSIAKSKFSTKMLDFQNIFQSFPAIKSNYHFGCRMTIDYQNYLFASIGERGKGNIAQNYRKHPGSIIRINLDGSAPKDNPKFIQNNKWLPEIYQIGIRNPQGMTFSPFNKKIYISNHGPRGGDFLGEVKFGTNYGWKLWCWGGRNYDFTRCGKNKKKSEFLSPLITWVPSIGVSAIQVYDGEEFPSWKKKILVTSLKDKSLRIINNLDNNKFKEKIVFQGDIGEIRDIKITKTGKVLLLSNRNSALWVLHNP